MYNLLIKKMDAICATRSQIFNLIDEIESVTTGTLTTPETGL